MSAPFAVPVNIPYPSPLFGQPSKIPTQANEGPKAVPGNINWSTIIAGGASCTLVDCAQVQSNPISQISSLFVDNINSNTDVYFLFPDSGFQLHILPGEGGFYPVTTQGVKFYVNAPNAGSTDITNFVVYNHEVYPVSLGAPFLEATAAVNSNAIITGTTAVISTPATGVITGVNLEVCGQTAATPSGSNIAFFAIVDGAGGNLAFGTIATGQGVSFGPAIIINLQNCAMPYSGGVTLNISVSGSGGGFSTAAFALTITHR